MADFGLSEEERMVQQLAHEFAVKEIRPQAAYFDEHEELPREIIAKASELGLAAGIFGGGSAGISSVIIAEELAWGCAGIALAIAASGLAAAAIIGIGTPEQQAKFLPMAISSDGQVRLGAMGLTEPEAGSDVQALSTTAVRDGDDYVLNGTKRFITNGGIADVHVIFATEDKSKGWGGLAAFVIEKGTPGLSEGTVWKKMGIRASHTADVILEDCRIPAENRLGPPVGGSGAAAVPGALGALKMLERTRPSIGAFALGIARAALEYATEYAKERRQFGKPLIAHEGIAFKLADMAMAYDSARLAGAPRRVDGGGGRAAAARGGLDGEVLRVGRGDAHHDRRRADLRRLRLHARVPGREVGTGRQDLPDLRGDERDPAPGDQPRAWRAVGPRRITRRPVGRRG